MGLYVIRTADSGYPAARRDAARGGRAAAMSRRRALAAGQSALAPAHERVRTGFRQAELRVRGAAVDGTPPTASNGQGAPGGGQRAVRGTAAATDGVGDARLGRALSIQHRRQLSQGKQALKGAGRPTATAAGTPAPGFVVHHGGAR